MCSRATDQAVCHFARKETLISAKRSRTQDVRRGGTVRKSQSKAKRRGKVQGLDFQTVQRLQGDNNSRSRGHRGQPV